MFNTAVHKILSIRCNLTNVQNAEFDLENNYTNNNVKKLYGCLEEYKSNVIEEI